MKKYTRLEIHVKEAKINEKADAAVSEQEIFFDKKDIECITKQSSKIFNRKPIDDLIDGLLEGVSAYRIYFKSGNYTNNVILTEDELAELCE